ncbi:MAG: cupin domain-containing protein [Halobellus sp.]|uniref:cupin domain-containing protein n=1 Tax=Halobellus sp. TaxID=1979212 RepID=UPI0035D5269D
MSYTKTYYADGDEKAPGLYFLREDLDCENLGFTVIEVDAGWEGIEHDHESDGQEEVYYLLDGAVTLDIEGDEVSLEPGDAVRVAGDTARKMTAQEASTLVAVGAP